MEKAYYSSLNTEELIILSPLLLQTLLNTVPTGIQVLRAVRNTQFKIVDFEYILFNEEAKAYTELGKTFLTKNPDLKELFNYLVEETESGLENEITHPFSMDGLSETFNISYKKFGDGVLLSLEDITENKIREEKNGDSQHLMQQIAESTPDVIFILDLATGLPTYTNRQIAEDLGYSKDQIAQMRNTLLDTLYEEDVVAMKEHLEKTITIPDNTILEIEHRMKNVNGSLSWYCTRSSVFKRNKTGIPVEKLGISQNITSRKLQEEQNSTTLNILKQAEEISEMGTWVYDVKDDTFSWSEGMYRLFNLPGDVEVLPEIYLDFVPVKEKSITRQIVQKIKTATPFEERIHLLIPGKVQKTVLIKSIVLKDKDGKPAKSVGVDRDVTAQMKLEEKIGNLNQSLLASNRELATVNLELQTFSSIAANNYKETLKQLYTNLEYITSAEAANLSNAGRANIRRAQAAIQKMKLLTEDIIVYSSIQAIDDNKTEVDIKELMDTIKLNISKKIKEESIEIDCDDRPVLQGYPALLSLLFRHLVDNSIKFVQEGKKTIIHIRCSRQEGSAINHPSVLGEKNYNVITISDNGHGFNPEHAEDIFNMFYRETGTNNRKSSGMGLAICKKIMDIHGGFILAESIPGNGSVFSCYFPIEKD